MANTAFMEDTVTTGRDVRHEERRPSVQKQPLSAEEEHKNKISENYQKLIYETHDSDEAWTNERSHEMSHRPAAEAYAGSYAPASYAAPAGTATLERPVMPVHESVAPAQTYSAPRTEDNYSANTAQRLADYVAYQPARKKPGLFEGLVIKDGEIIDARAGAAAPAVAPAPAVMGAPAPAPAVMGAPAQMYTAAPAVAAPMYAPAPVEMPAAPVFAPAAEEDALPTRRTMEVLQTGEATKTQTGVGAAISLKTKLLLCAVVAAIVLIIALICINSGILTAVNADISGKEAQLRDLQSRYAQMQEDIDYFQSGDYIDAWAEENGMVRGN